MTIIVVGVGSMLDRPSLMNFVSEPKYYFEVSDLANINNYVTPVGEMVNYVNLTSYGNRIYTQ